jgi:hypothetical protein
MEHGLFEMLNPSYGVKSHFIFCSEIQFNPEGLRSVEEAAGFLKPLVHTHQTSRHGVTTIKFCSHRHENLTTHEISFV